MRHLITVSRHEHAALRPFGRHLAVAGPLEISSLLQRRFKGLKFQAAPFRATLFTLARLF
jgi:hypothetical protein